MKRRTLVIVYISTATVTFLQVLSILVSHHVTQQQQHQNDGVLDAMQTMRKSRTTTSSSSSVEPLHSFHRLVQEWEDDNTTSTSGSILGPIPHILWFTYQHNILHTKEPRHYYDNVVKTIQAYRTAWNDTKAPVYFLTNEDCMILLQHVDQKENITLAKAFLLEERGPVKADLCRLAALFLRGGYYLDVDLEVVQPVRMAISVSFSTVRSLVGFFQAFLAASRGHPVIKTNLQLMMDAYFTHQEKCWNVARSVLGPCTLKKAWRQWEHRYDGASSRFLDETNLQQPDGLLLYPNMTQRGKGEHCHWVVHDRVEQQVYFYSRIVGTNLCQAEE